MTTIETHAVTGQPTGFVSRVEWSAVIAGAVAAAALAFVLHGFATAIGLLTASAAPTWRDASFALVFLSGLYLLLAALVSYGFGGYVAGRLAPRTGGAFDLSLNFRDGMHGILVWALATLLTGLMALAVLQVAPRLSSPAGSTSNSASSASENIIAFDLDRLFRGSERRQQADMSETRAEAGRILLTTSSHSGLQADDRAYLVRLVTANTGLSAADADRRVADVAVRAKQTIDRARHSAAILAFFAAAVTLLGAAAAWYAACAAARYREGHEAIPTWWEWSDPR